MRLLNVIFTIIVGMLTIPIIRSIYADFMPTIEELGTVPEIAMWKLMPLMILFCILIASIANLVRTGKKRQ